MANLGTLELSLLFKYIFIYHVIFYETDKMWDSQELGLFVPWNNNIVQPNYVE
jgi:hypothetical protein